MNLFPDAMTPQEWAKTMGFSLRYERDFNEIAGADVPPALVEALNEVEKSVTDIVLSGGLGKEWGEQTPENLKARSAVARILARAASELTLSFGLESEQGEALQLGAPTAPDEPETDEGAALPVGPNYDDDGRPTMEFWGKCSEALAFAVEFGRLCDTGEEMEMSSPIENVIEGRRAFALAPEALQVFIDTYEELRRGWVENARKDLDALIGPLPPEDAPEPQAEAD